MVHDSYLCAKHKKRKWRLIMMVGRVMGNFGWQYCQLTAWHQLGFDVTRNSTIRSADPENALPYNQT